MPASLPPDETHAWLALLRAPGVGSVKLKRLLERHGSAAAALAAGSPAWRAAGLDDAGCAALTQPDAAALARDQAWLAAPDCHLLTCIDADFPPMLARMPHAPAALFVQGTIELLWTPQVGVVGSRNPTAGGRDNATAFARALSEAGLTITSGLAEGIDACAHRAALDRRAPTIAVMGTGPDVVYPARHRELAAAIAARGALVTEHPPGTTARREHFPRRNRIIAGLSLGVVVVEAALQSGALITARLAAEAGREVFALPGSIHNPMARGCHRLIREGAQLVETAPEIVAALAPAGRELGADLRARLAEHDANAGESVADGGDPDYRRLVAALGHDPVGLDVLADRTGLTVDALSSMLLLMELDGRVSAKAGRYALRS